MMEMPSVDVGMVREIMGFPPDVPSDGLIQLAAKMAWGVSQACLSRLSEDLRGAIMLWLTCHFLASTAAGSQATGGDMTSDKLGDASRSWARAALGTGLASTSYGMRALELDGTGCLAALGKKTASIERI